MIPLSPPIPLHQNFPDTALRTAALKTAAHGEAEVGLTMPESLTAGRTRVWAIGAGSRVGEASLEVVTAKDWRRVRDSWGRLADEDPNPVFDPDKVKDMVRAGIERLASMQCGDGGWGWFSGYGEHSWAHTTAYVVHGPQLARDSDVKLPDAYLTNFTLGDPVGPAGLEVKVERRAYKLEREDASTTAAGDRGQALTQKVEKFRRVPLPNGSLLKSGDLVEVELEIDSKNDYEYVVFEDMKAAGFEPVDVRSGYTANVQGRCGR
ncbi:MAG: hypothetical protein HYZ53_01300 [Planctomycetes bacterium]|nr:hypothetical protein [Planctomycetota bacterium]